MPSSASKNDPPKARSFERAMELLSIVLHDRGRSNIRAIASIIEQAMCPGTVVTKSL